MEVKRVLVVCTDDRSRSPAAVALLRRRLGPQAEAFEIWSAGTGAHEGDVLLPLTAEALTQLAAGVRRHQARRLLLDDVLGADLVLCAERKHRVHVARMSTDAAAMTFTVAEFARIAPHLRPAGFVHMLAQAVDVRGDYPAAQPADDDLARPGEDDPLDHERMIRRLNRFVTPIAAALALAAVEVESRSVRLTRRRYSREVVLPPAAGAPVRHG